MVDDGLGRLHAKNDDDVIGRLVRLREFILPDKFSICDDMPAPLSLFASA
jgi:hypothetical protein